MAGIFLEKIGICLAKARKQVHSRGRHLLNLIILFHCGLCNLVLFAW
jgi:hypothetical protein